MQSKQLTGVISQEVTESTPNTVMEMPVQLASPRRNRTIQELNKIPLEEWTQSEQQAFEVRFGWSAPAMSKSQLNSFTLGEPTNPPVAAQSRSGYSLDTSFIYPGSNERVTNLRVQHEYDNIDVAAIPTTESSGGLMRVVTLYTATTRDGVFSTPITYATYQFLLGVRAGDDEAYNDGTDITYTEDQSEAIEASTEPITADRMSPRESALDGHGRLKKFRPDTRWPANPLTGEPYPDKP
jgi:hypothetical protein